MRQKDLSFPLAKLRIGQSMCWINNNFYQQNNTRQMSIRHGEMMYQHQWRIQQVISYNSFLYYGQRHRAYLNMRFNAFIRLFQQKIYQNSEGMALSTPGQTRSHQRYKYLKKYYEQQKKVSLAIQNGQGSPKIISKDNNSDNNNHRIADTNKHKKQIQTQACTSQQSKEQEHNKEAQKKPNQISTQTESINQQIQTPKKPAQQQISRQYVHKSLMFFIGDVLDDEQDYKLYLTSHIQQNFKRNIKRTPLLFNYHPRRNQNFHPYIDGISPFIFVAKTTQGFHIAAISQGKLDHKKHQQKRGWIISLTNRKSYPSLTGKSAISYDQVYLIFGNQQLRIQGTSLSMFSNFGMSAGYYQSNGDKLRNLFGENSKEIQLQSFQIFKIQFL